MVGLAHLTQASKMWDYNINKIEKLYSNEVRLFFTSIFCCFSLLYSFIADADLLLHNCITNISPVKVFWQWLIHYVKIMFGFVLCLNYIYAVKPLSILSEGTVKNILWMQENDSCGKVIYMDDVQGPEKVNDTCMKTVHAGTQDRGFSVYTVCQKLAVLPSPLLPFW
jgi:hypothetical protein